MPTSTVRVNIAQLTAGEVTEMLDEVWSTQYGRHTTIDFGLGTVVVPFPTGSTGAVIIFPPGSYNVTIDATTFALNPNSKTTVVYVANTTGLTISPTPGGLTGVEVFYF